MALGARARNVLSLILREAVLLVLIGVAIGVPIVLYVSRFAKSLLFELSPTDPCIIGSRWCGVASCGVVRRLPAGATSNEG